MRRDARADLQRYRHVLAGLPFPAAKWQVITHAEHYGADAATRAELWALPIGDYPDLATVLAALGLAVPAVDPARRGHRRGRPVGAGGPRLGGA